MNPPNAIPRQLAYDEVWMREALALAVAAARHDEVPVGAVVVKDGTCIGRGHNRSVTDHDPSAHAEVMALRDAARAAGDFRLDGATLYVTVEPCLMCCGALLQARISRLVFGAREPKTGAVVSAFESLMAQRQSHPIAITEGVLAEEAVALMQRWFAARR
ncbi:MAG: tRNA-specific adenosine deaminase [Gammaproteobacteria bacterium]|nr:MAG: tRNA-specific adenosine deaminase [Gammaproteobacteria bacterium]